MEEHENIALHDFCKWSCIFYWTKSRRYIYSYLRGRSCERTLDPRLIGETVNGVNAYFANLGPATVAAEGIQVDAEDQLPRQCPKFFGAFRAPSFDDIDTILRGIDESKSAGPDGIPGGLIKNGAHVLAPVLQVLISNIVSKSRYPESLKTSLLYPVHKSGSVQDMSNFRPISLLPVINRIIEKLLVDQIYSSIENRGLLSSRQFGFRRGHSCAQAANYLVNYAAESMDLGQHCAAIFFDASKAFDTVSHERLLGKLERLGVFGDALRLLRSYLTGRRQTFRCGDDTSGEEMIRMGVPQGSNFGPLLFIVFINDLLNLSIDGEVLSFADDTAIILRHEDIDVLAERASACSSALHRWMSVNGLVLNASKTRCLLFSKRCTTLSFQMHHPICSTFGTCRCVNIRNAAHHKLLFYGGASPSQRACVNVLQRRTIKVTMCLAFRTDSQPVYRVFRTFPVEVLRNIAIVLLVHPILHILPTSQHEINTRRSASRLILPTRLRLTSTDNLPLPTFVSLYNQLPDEIRTLLENQHVCSDLHLERSVQNHYRTEYFFNSRN